MPGHGHQSEHRLLLVPEHRAKALVLGSLNRFASVPAVHVFTFSQAVEALTPILAPIFR